MQRLKIEDQKKNAFELNVWFRVVWREIKNPWLVDLTVGNQGFRETTNLRLILTNFSE